MAAKPNPSSPKSPKIFMDLALLKAAELAGTRSYFDVTRPPTR